jgi:hypothetical protein
MIELPACQPDGNVRQDKNVSTTGNFVLRHPTADKASDLSIICLLGNL